MGLDNDDPRKGTIDDPEVEDPYWHLRKDAPAPEDSPEPEPEAPGTEGTPDAPPPPPGDQAGL